MQNNKYIDHTLLKPEATKEQIITLCNEALEHNFASVCVNPTWVSTCSELLKSSDSKVCTVIGFPLGANTTATKVFETKDAVANGAQEIDMVINVGELKAGNSDYVYNEIKGIVEAASPNIVKVIIETCLLSNEEIVLACELSMKAKTAFVKTSTGFSTGGATVEDVVLMKSVVKDELEVKASGGVRTKEDFEAMVAAGATRIGTSNGSKLV